MFNLFYYTILLEKYLLFDIFPSTNGYSYHNELYHKNFPEEWATSHIAETGPKRLFGLCFLRIFGGHLFGYCCNCAVYKYNFSRGPPHLLERRKILQQKIDEYNK
jgi:hypothetical protein